MRVSIGHDRSEGRGLKLLPAMVFAWAIVIVAIMGVVADRQWWIVGAVLAVEIGVIFTGARWLLPVLSDGEVADASEAPESQATATAFGAVMAGIADHRTDNQPAGRTPDVTPRNPAGLRVVSAEFSETHPEQRELGGVAGR